MTYFNFVNLKSFIFVPVGGLTSECHIYCSNIDLNCQVNGVLWISCIMLQDLSFIVLKFPWKYVIYFPYKNIV